MGGGCGCGGGTIGGNPRTGVVEKEVPCWPGSDAEILVEYTGVEERIIRLGVVTGVVYQFGISSRIKRVDVWDMPRLIGDQEIRKLGDKMIEEKEEKKEEKRKVRKPVTRKSFVRIMREQDDRLLVEWVDTKGMLRSVFIGADELIDGRVDNDVLDEAIPYGVPWEEAFIVAQKKATPEVRANELRKVGIWTLDDLREKSRFVLGALKAGFMVEIGELNKLATRLKEEVK